MLILLIVLLVLLLGGGGGSYYCAAGELGWGTIPTAAAGCWDSCS